MTSLPTSVTLPPPRKVFVPGLSPAVQKLNCLVEEIARTNIPVLLMGESGTGKDVYGLRIHRLSNRGDKPLKRVCCRAVGQGEFLSQLRAELKESSESPEEGLR